MTYNTGNPIGSTDARDRSDNSENLDLAVNSLEQTFVDRLGVTRDTLEGIYQKSVYYRVGTFDADYTLTNNRQTLAYENIEYSWSGAFPKVVTAGSTPVTSGGIGAGAWVDRTQETLRSDLATKLGSIMIGTSRALAGVERSLASKLEDLPTAEDYLLSSETDLSLAISRAVSDSVSSLYITGGRNYTISAATELPDDFEVTGLGRPSVVCANIANIVRMNSRTKVSGLKVSGLSPAVFSPHNGAKDVEISDNFFSGQSQIVLLFSCSSVDICKNVFDGTGYGVIQQAGYASNDIRVTQNRARDMVGDFVEANAATVDTKNWLISGNIYDGARDWTVLSTERRFIGITQVEDVIITNNIVRRTAGDGAVHLEDSLGRVLVEGNIFVDCFAGQGAIYNLNSAKDMRVSGNVFVLTDAYMGVNKHAIRTDSGSYSHKCQIDHNWFYDVTGAQRTLRPALLAQGGYFDYHDNIMFNTYDAASFNSISRASFSRNRSYGELQRGIWCDNGATGNAGADIIYNDNVLPLITDTAYGILATTNTNGTNGPKRHAAYNNHIGGDIRLQNMSGAVGQTAENTAWGNRVTGSIVVSDRLTADAFGNYTLTTI